MFQVHGIRPGGLRTLASIFSDSHCLGKKMTFSLNTHFLFNKDSDMNL